MLFIYTYPKKISIFGSFYNNVDIPFIGLQYKDNKQIFDSVLLNTITIFILDMITFCITFPFWFIYTFITEFIYRILFLIAFYPIMLLLHFISETSSSISSFINLVATKLVHLLVQQRINLFKNNN